MVEQPIPGDSEDPLDVDLLWNLYYERLKAVVRSRVKSIKRPVANESEIALSAIHSLVRHLREKDIVEPIDLNEMWRLLRRVALRKAGQTRKYLLAKRRGGNERFFNQADIVDKFRQHSDLGSLRAEPSHETDEIDAIDWFDHLLSRLPDDRYRDLVLLKLEGRTTCEIADLLQICTRTVKRMLARIEQQWMDESDG